MPTGRSSSDIVRPAEISELYTTVGVEALTKAADAFPTL